MGYESAALSASAAAGMASNIASRNADKLETIEDTTEGTYTLVESLHKGVRILLDVTRENQGKLDALIVENKELRQKINSLENQLNKPATYAR